MTIDEAARVHAYTLVTMWAQQMRDDSLTTHGLHDVRRRIRAGEVSDCPQHRELLFLVVQELKRRHNMPIWHDPSDEVVVAVPDTPTELLALIDWRRRGAS